MSIATVPYGRPLDIAVIGAGISGLSAAWLLSQSHRVTLYEEENRPGGHAHTVDAGGAGPVDTGFIVYNEPNYPNLTALFDHLGVATSAAEMSFSASLNGGRVEYAGNTLGTLFAQKRNLLRPRFLAMVRDILRFYREAPRLLDTPDPDSLSLGEFLDRGRYSEAFVADHLLPMAAAIWSAPARTMRAYPAAAFVRFCQNHGLLQVTGRPSWRTVDGGSRCYVERLVAALCGGVRLDTAVMRIFRDSGRVELQDRQGHRRSHDHVVVATHADQALRLLDEPSAQEMTLLGAIRSQSNLAVLHSDAALMPRRRRVWSSWNYLSEGEADGEDRLCVTYWMNRLQGFLPKEPELFVTLNPIRPPREGTELGRFSYDHPVFDGTALAAQRRLWELQGVRNTWYCGAWFGAGFHEDGLQAGLAVAEELGGVRRPWSVAGESGRIHRTARPAEAT